MNWLSGETRHYMASIPGVFGNEQLEADETPLGTFVLLNKGSRAPLTIEKQCISRHGFT